MKKVQNTFWGMMLSLTLICLVFTGLLAVVYAVTLDPIAQAEQKKQEDAIKAVQNDFTEVKTDVVTVDIDGKQTSYTVFKTYNNGVWNGTAVESDALGFGGNIKLMVGFDTEGKVVDYSVLSHSETPGLGSKMDPWFKTSITGRQMTSTPLKVSKDGGDVDAITAATISSRAFLSAVNNAYKAYLQTVENK